MGFETARDGAGFRLSFQGIAISDEVRRGFEALRDGGLGDETPYVLVDFSEAESIEMSIEDHHRLHLVLRTMFSKGPDFRVALVAASDRVRSQLSETIAVRDLMTGRSSEELPTIGFFESVDDARPWARSPDG